MREYIQLGYFKGYPVFAVDDFTAEDGLSIVKLDPEHPLEGWLTSIETAEKMLDAGVSKKNPRDCFADLPGAPL